MVWAGSAVCVSSESLRRHGERGPGPLRAQKAWGLKAGPGEVWARGFPPAPPGVPQALCWRGPPGWGAGAVSVVGRQAEQLGLEILQGTQHEGGLGGQVWVQVSVGDHDHLHPGREGRLHPVGRVLEDQALRGEGGREKERALSGPSRYSRVSPGWARPPRPAAESACGHGRSSSGPRKGVDGGLSAPSPVRGVEGAGAPPT